MSVINNAPEANQKTLEPQQHGDTSVKVNVRLIFLRIGEIDTLNEKYQAQASIKASWPVDFNELSSCLSHDDQKRLLDGKSVSLPNYAQSNWHPQLFIENVMGELKEQIKYSAKKSKQDNQICVFENRDIKGSFWEKLELNHFPSDVQDLSISIGSMLYSDKALLVPDPNHLSGVNRESFADQQEWSLYEHVDTQQRFIKEFPFDDDDDDDNDEEDDNGNIHSSVEHHVDNQLENTDDKDDRKRSVLTVTCHAARRSHYFYWNGYCLILLITMVSFCIFSIPAHFTGNRIQIVCTLLLTSITFRWTVNRSLPTISYLTTMDKYAIVCMFNLVAHSIWHAAIGFLIFTNTTSPAIISTSWFAKLDQTAFCFAIGAFVILHFIFIIWLLLVPLKHRKYMAHKDVQYNLAALEKKKSRKCKSNEIQKKTSSGYTAVPVVNI